MAISTSSATARLQFLYTPGHTPGESTLVANFSNRTIVLPGDTVHLRAALDQEATMPVDVDPITATLSLQRIKALRDITRRHGVDHARSRRLEGASAPDRVAADASDHAALRMALRDL